MSKVEEIAMEHCCAKCVHDKFGCSMKVLHNGKDCIKCGNYIKGYHQAEEDLLDNVWHSPDEEPEIDRKIIWEYENFLGKHLDEEWKPKIDCFGRKERWCYLADILPSENWTEERPYSKVDYNRGYEKGYEEAEKDLELTNADVYEIWRIYNEVCAEGKIFGFDETNQEVLKRFKGLKHVKQKI